MINAIAVLSLTIYIIGLCLVLVIRIFAYCEALEHHRMGYGHYLDANYKAKARAVFASFIWPRDAFFGAKRILDDALEGV